jgi:uncharacterized RDD family membrane protein YckC
MPTRKRDHSLGEGVYYTDDDYIGIVRRLVILCIDLTVIVLVGITLAGALIYVYPQVSAKTAARLVFFSWLTYGVLAVAYLTVVKASQLRTIGYRLTGTKIVDLRGKRPAAWRMVFRFSLWIFGPFSLFFDLIWAGADQDRQTIRDRFAGTCVVRHKAEPAGCGEIHLAYFTGGGYALVYPRVIHREPGENDGAKR